MPRKITFSVVSIRDTAGAIDGTGGAVAIGVVATERGAVAGSGRRVVGGVGAAATPAAMRSGWSLSNPVTNPTTSAAARTITRPAIGPGLGVAALARPSSTAGRLRRGRHAVRLCIHCIIMRVLVYYAL
jgi:hypothetical protein